jgi:hypothetical protein
MYLGRVTKSNGIYRIAKKELLQNGEDYIIILNQIHANKSLRLPTQKNNI